MSNTLTADPDIETPAPEPMVAPLAVETVRWYAVSNVDDLTDAQDRLFRATQCKVWERPFRGWMVVVYGWRTDGGGRAAKVYAADHDAEALPDWARPLLPGHAARERGLAALMRQIDRYARDYLHPAIRIDAERDDIERQLVALAAAGAARAGGPQRGHAGLGLPCEICPGACVIDQEPVA